MKIEKASSKDIEEIYSLQRRAFKQEAELYNKPDIEPLTVTLEETRREFEDAVFLKMTEAGKIIGSVRANVKGGTCLVRKLIVEPGLQNRGYGRALMEAVEKECAGCTRFELYTGHKSENNKHLYKKLGYNIIETKTMPDGAVLVYMVKPAGQSKIPNHKSQIKRENQ
jgi:N-acetylglutamate synthase-like GNAT family acetyltransferase